MLDPDLEARIRERVRDAPFAAWFGMELITLDDGVGELRLELERHHLNPGGIAHGGVAAAMLDAAIGLALRTRIGMDRTHVTLQLNVNYLRPIATGTLVARGQAVRSGERVGYGEGSLEDADGTLLARANATFMVWEPAP